MTRCRCGVCEMEFKTKKEKKEHKRKYPNQSCKELKGGKTEMEEEVKIVQEEEKEILKEIPKIKVPKEQAKEEWKKYCNVLKNRKEKYLQVMKDAYYQMKEGNELIDLYKIMKDVGLTENNLPKLAIARADFKECLFEKQDEGAGAFGCIGKYNQMDWSSRIQLPQNTFNIHWERSENNTWQIKDKSVKTRTPIIPIELLPDGDLSNYYILWETNNWIPIPETKDPILLKRISENLFAILGSWEVTELEQSVIRGRK